MPLTDYVATLRLTPVTDGDRTFVEWTAEFDCAPRREAEGLVNGIGTNVFQARLQRAQAADGRLTVPQVVKSTVLDAPVEAVWDGAARLQRA